jgi:hypothetical protein
VCHRHTGQRQNRTAVLSRRFLGIFFLLVFLKTAKKPPVPKKCVQQFLSKKANRDGLTKNAGGSEKMGVGPAGMGDPHFFG